MHTSKFLASISCQIMPLTPAQQDILEPLKKKYLSTQAARRNWYYGNHTKYGDWYDHKDYKKLQQEEVIATGEYNKFQQSTYRLAFCQDPKHMLIHLAGCCGARQASSKESFFSSGGNGVNTLLSDEQLPFENTNTFRYNEFKWSGGWLYTKELINRALWNGEKLSEHDTLEDKTIKEVAHIFLGSVGRPAQFPYPADDGLQTPELLVAIYGPSQQGRLEEWHAYVKTSLGMSPEYVSTGRCFNANYSDVGRLQLVVYRKD